VKREGETAQGASLWVQQMGQNMSNGMLQPFLFRLLSNVEQYIPKRPRRIKVTETISPTRYKATSQVQGGLKRRRKRK
jgi:hypothetical protein